jgi:hypothetical protein
VLGEPRGEKALVGWKVPVPLVPVVLGGMGRELEEAEVQG